MSEKAKQNLIKLVGVVLLAVVIYLMGVRLLETISGSRIFGFLSGLVSKELTTDGFGHTNILLLGVGTGAHEGKDLTDTIIIASIDKKDNSVGMISIPRDLYLKTSLGSMKVNALYEQAKSKWTSSEGIDFVRDAFEGTFNIPLHYVVKVDFTAFEEVVDTLGGVDIYVENDISDQEYPNESFGYEPFHLSKGLQHLNGKTALKYARSRKSSSDFDRSKRQQSVLVALKEKATREGFLGSTRLIKNLYYSLTEHVETDMSLREMLSLAKFGATWDSKHLSAATLNDEPIYRGGLLYVPLRELYGGAYVLLPASDKFDSINFFIQLVLYGPKNLNDLGLAILNGTKESGLAARERNILYRLGIQIVALGNARKQDLEETVWYVVAPEAETLAKFLQSIMPGEISNEVPAEYKSDPKFADAKLILELGKNALPTIEKTDIFKNVVLLVPRTGTTTPK